MGILRNGSAAALLIAMSMSRAAFGEDQPLTLEAAIANAMSANKSLATARLGRGVARAGVDIAGERPNPELAVEVERETPHQAYTLSLPLELGGKRKRRIELSEATSGSYEAEIARMTAAVRVSVRRAYFTLAAAQRRTAAMEELAGLAERVRQTASDRFDLGDASRLEVLQADLSLAQARNDSSAAGASVSAARIDLNTLMARPPGEPVTAVEDLDAGAVPEASVAVELATSASVDLALLDHRIAEEHARLNLAHAGRVPDVAIQGAITRDSEPEFDTGWRAGVSFGLPLLNRHQGEIRLEEATLAQLQSERDASLLQIRSTVTSTLLLASSKRDQYLRYRDQILAQAAEVEQLAAESYSAGQTGLVTMLQAFGAARDIRLKSVESGMEYQIALADLEQAIGAPLP